tara:strand:+ start:2535 stop:2900 length:366 start_codon:yes stop_codon:yes gene_type:complete
MPIFGIADATSSTSSVSFKRPVVSIDGSEIACRRLLSAPRFFRPPTGPLRTALAPFCRRPPPFDTFDKTDDDDDDDDDDALANIIVSVVVVVALFHTAYSCLLAMQQKKKTTTKKKRDREV